MKILAVVKFNSTIALVLDTPLDKKYTKYGNTIIGVDGIFHTSYERGECSERWKAFAGRKFDIQLTDGTVEHCHGQWWDGISKKTIEIVGDDITSITAAYIGDLKRCYVFYPHYASRASFRELLSTYKGRIYNYYEYEATITDNPYRRKNRLSERLDKRVKKNWKRFNQKPLIGESPLLKLHH